MRFFRMFMFLPLIVTVSACSGAKKASEVGSVYVPAGNYKGLSCDELFQEAEAVRQRVPQLEREVDRHYKNEKGKEMVTWLLFAPAAFLYDSNSEGQSALSVAKGQLQAIQTAMISKKCG